MRSPALFPTCALKSPKRIVGWLVLTFYRASLISFTNPGTIFLSFGSIPVSNTDSGPRTSTSICTRFLLVGSSHQYSLPAEGLQVYPLQPGKFFWLNAGVKEFPCLAQLNSFRTTTLSQREVNNIQGILFG